jgi:hypothetical protein
MTTIEEDIERLIEDVDKREPGVVDLLELYERVERVYVPASQASGEVPFVTGSNSTNPG